MNPAKELNQLRMELTWSPRQSNVPVDNFDLDVCAFMLDEDDRLLRDEYFVFYNNLRSPADAVVLKADDIDGADGEVLLINLSKVPAQVRRLLFLVTIYNAEARMQSFDDITDATVSLYDRTDGSPIVKCRLSDVAQGSTAVQFAEIVRGGDGEWSFRPLARGEREPLAHYVALYSRNT